VLDNKIGIRVSAYDLNYFMPSTATFQISINISPIQGTITVSPLKGDTLF